MHWFWRMLSWFWPFGRPAELRRKRQATEKAVNSAFSSKLQETLVLGSALQEAVLDMKQSREARQRATR
jgi:hypothetical protein